MAANNRFVPFHQLDREWDARFNVPNAEDLQALLKALDVLCNNESKLRYALVSGVEIGQRPYQTDYLIKHVHCALVFNNRVSKSAILKNLLIKTGNGYYLVPRNRDYPFSGWKKHHTKLETKVNPQELILFEYGTLPEDRLGPSALTAKRSEDEKKLKLDEIIVQMKTMIENGQEVEAFAKFPRNYLTYGEKIKAMVHQKRDYFKTNGDPHIWVYGNPGSGKSAILQVIYPEYFNKNLDTKFFDRFDSRVHTHVLFQDVDHNTIEKLGVQFFKSVCDEAGYPIDQKYKTPQIERLTILVSSNFTIQDVIPEDMKGRRENLAALQRRFYSMHINNLLRIIGVKLLDKYEINQLKKAKNTDPSKCFLSYDYIRDVPTGAPLKTPLEYQDIIRSHYYS